MPARSEQSTMGPAEHPLVCMYLFLDADGATLPPHPSPRTASPLRYLECAVVQAASLTLAGASCRPVLLTNAVGGPGRAWRRMWDALCELGVEVREVALRIEPGTPSGATRLPFEAIRAVAGGVAGPRTLWVPNLDCVWVDPARALAARPERGRIGALAIPYPPGWAVGGPEAVGASREELGRTASAMGAPPGGPPPWIGADLLAGTGDALLALAAACEELDGRLARGGTIATNEQLLTLAAALGRAGVEDLSGVARRIQTGARHTAAAPADAAELGIWHLPAEKGLSLRRAARALARGRSEPLRADLSSSERSLRRFNVGEARRTHQLRDDAWVAWGRLSGARGVRPAVRLPAGGRVFEGRIE
jgi:hypothetical protein